MEEMQTQLEHLLQLLPGDSVTKFFTVTTETVTIVSFEVQLNVEERQLHYIFV